jgi:hypothetical protein
MYSDLISFSCVFVIAHERLLPIAFQSQCFCHFVGSFSKSLYSDQSLFVLSFDCIFSLVRSHSMAFDGTPFRVRLRLHFFHNRIPFHAFRSNYFSRVFVIGRSKFVCGLDRILFVHFGRIRPFRARRIVAPIGRSGAGGDSLRRSIASSNWPKNTVYNGLRDAECAYNSLRYASRPRQNARIPAGAPLPPQSGNLADRPKGRPCYRSEARIGT